MIPHKSTYPWSCMVDSFAMHTNVTPLQLMDMIGHHGGEITDPEQPEPFNHRGFHIREIFQAMYQLGYIVSHVDKDMVTQSLDVPMKMIVATEEQNQFLRSLIDNHNTVIAGEFPRPHALACNGIDVYDCRTPELIIPLNQFLQTYWDNIWSIYVITKLIT